MRMYVDVVTLPKQQLLTYLPTACNNALHAQSLPRGAACYTSGVAAVLRAEDARKWTIRE